MKIFLSHSSKDKWAARRIADDIVGLGHEVFIDEKDIKTGQSIDGAIRTHLLDSDHFLILLSPASVDSEWVLLELGGALALEKEVIPILLYVGVNDVPQAINLKLARDINDVSAYYDELEKAPRASKSSKKSAARSGSRKKSAAKRSAAKKKSHKREFKKGDRVKIVLRRPADALRESLSLYWKDDMDQFLGQTSTITRIRDTGSIKLEIDNEYWGWAPEWLVLDQSA